MGSGKKIRFFVVASIVIAFLFAGISEAKINDKESKEISEMLKIANFPVFADYTVEQLKTILNKVIKPKEDLETTYGVLIMASFNEMDFMDAILSQRFLDRDRAYFNDILQKRIDLLNHWKKVGQNVAKVLQKGSSATPMTALALESVDMTNKVIAILVAFNTWKDMETYKGLWRYFDSRINGESHRVSWEDANAEISIRINSPRIEQQFAALYEKWGPYATPYGISEKYKKQLAGELRDTLAMALEEYNFAKEEPGSSLLQKLAVQLENIKNILASLASKANPFRAGPLVELSVSEPAEEITDVGSLEEVLLVEKTTPEPVPVPPAPVPSPPPEKRTENWSLTIPEKRIENGSLTISDELTVELPVGQTSESVAVPEPAPVAADTPVAEDGPPQATAPRLCEKRAGDLPKQYRILINEVAWMGTKDSANNEWIKLKNIFGLPINLSGWQMQDKDQQIKKIFGENDSIPANGYLLLERSKDYTGALNNTEEALYIFDNNCQLEDEVLANPDWPAGDNSAKEPMKRFDALYWYSGNKAPNFYGSSAPTLTPTPAPVAEAQAGMPSFAVLINEIAWAGTKANSADEWIELYNTTGSSVNLTGWTLKAADGTPSITFSTSSIPAQGYFLLERTDDTSVSDISADWMGSFGTGLSNSGEKLELRDVSNNLIDSVDNSSGWAAGKASPDYVSMERLNSAAWADNNQVPWDGWIGKDADNNRINGTPKTKNSVSKISTAVTAGGFAINNNFTLTYLGSPYLVEGSINVLAGAKLIIQPGVTIKFKHSGYWHSELKVEGELEAIGGAGPSQKIVFTSSSTSPAAGDWEWLYLKGTKANLENVIVEYAGQKQGSPPQTSYFTRGAVLVESGDFTMRNSVVRNSRTVGAWFKNNTNGLIDNVEFSSIQGDWEKPAAVYIENATTTVRNSTFRNNNTGVWIDSLTGNVSPSITNNSFEDNQAAIQTSSLMPVFSGNTAQNNSHNGIVLTDFGFTDGVNQINWQPDLAYIIQGQPAVPSGKILNIAAGTSVKFKTAARIYVNGNLKANGSASQKITFTAYGTTWDYIGFSPSSTDSILDNVVVSNGGYYTNASVWGGAVQINGLNLTIKDSLFENNKIGIGLVDAGFSGQTSSVTMQNNWVGIFVEGNCPSLNAITISNSQNYNVFPAACQNP